MDEHYTDASTPHEQFAATMLAVEDAQPGFGVGIGRAIATVIEQEQAGDESVELIPDPHDILTEDETAMRHDLAGLQGLDLSPFGLAVAVTHDTGGDGSTANTSKVVLDDGAAFADFLHTVQPADINSHDFYNREDARWRLRHGLDIALSDILVATGAEIRDREAGGEGGLSHSAKQLLQHGPDIAQALNDSEWVDDLAEQRRVRQIAELGTYAQAGIGTAFLDLSASGILDDDTAHGPAGWVHDGPVDDRLINNWRTYGQAARDARDQQPELAGTWPTEVQRHYEATVRTLQSEGRIAELMALEGAVGQELRTS